MKRREASASIPPRDQGRAGSAKGDFRGTAATVGGGLIRGDQTKQVGRREDGLGDAAKAQLVRRRFRAFLAGECTQNS